MNLQTTEITIEQYIHRMRVRDAQAELVSNRYSARCKSGYTFSGRTCGQLTSRGELMCEDCKHAVRTSDQTTDQTDVRTMMTVTVRVVRTIAVFAAGLALVIASEVR